jgi:hypothetical protein
MGQEQAQQPALQPRHRSRSHPQDAMVGVVGVQPVRVANGGHAVTVRRPGQSTQAPTRIVKSAAEARVKRSAKQPNRRSRAMTGGWWCLAREQAEQAGDIVCKSASPSGGCE